MPQPDGAQREDGVAFAALAESLPQIVWVARPDGEHEAFNGRWSDYTGMTREASIGPGWLEAVHPEDRDRARGAWGRATALGEPYEVEYRFRRADGAYRWFLARALPHRDDGGRIVAWFGTATDIDDRRRAEAAQAELEAAGRAKDRFLAMLSHELRTPLTPVLLTATARLGDPDTPDDDRPTWEMIRRNIGLEARLIDDLLDVMKTISGKMPYHFEVIDAHSLLLQTLDIVRSNLNEKGIQLEARLEADRSHIKADPARLTQAFWNLVKNSVKFTGEGGGISVRTRNEGDQLFIDVSDTGIEPGALTKVFNAFEQVEDSVTREFGGLGLGLAIAKSVVDSHSGTIAASSPGKGQGATFTVGLLTVAPTSDLRAARGGVVADRRSFQILLVEDDAMTSRVMATLLRNAGHAITTANSYDAALDVAAAETGAGPDFDLVISDVGLPGRSGFDLMRELRARHGLLGIALTGFGQDEDIRKGRDAGFVMHMTKPVDFAKLDEMIQRAGLMAES